VQKKSLLAKAQETAGVAVPGAKASEMTLGVTATGNGGLDKLMGGGPPVAVPYVSAGDSPPYLFFYYGIGEGAEAAKKALPNVRKGDLVLVADGEYTILHSPVTVLFCTAHQHWAERVPATQQVVKASLEPQGRGSPLKEEIEALVLVLADDGLIPATWRTKSAACRGPVLALRELAAAPTPEWVAQSEAHRITAKIQQPWARFVAQIDYRLEASRSSGNEYVATDAVCHPIDPDTFAKLRDFVNASENQQRLGEAYAEHTRKVNEVKEKLAAA
jgi:hypothetical protein